MFSALDWSIFETLSLGLCIVGVRHVRLVLVRFVHLFILNPISNLTEAARSSISVVFVQWAQRSLWVMLRERRSSGHGGSDNGERRSTVRIIDGLCGIP